jgi:hypothetical protein
VLRHLQVLPSPFPEPLLIRNPTLVPNPMGFVFSCHGFVLPEDVGKRPFLSPEDVRQMAELNSAFMVKQCICTKVPGNNRII